MNDHIRAKHPHGVWFCFQCNRSFKNWLSLTTHLRFSESHNPRTQGCPGKCGKAFIRYADLAQHLESGACACGISRAQINRLAVEMDANRVITNPNRLIAGPDGFLACPQIMQSYATQRSFNGLAYECMLCRSTFRSLSALNTHLGSPAHDEKIYRCPHQYDGCGAEFKTLSAIMQHAESGSCAIYTYQVHVARALDDLSVRFGKIGFH